MFYGIGFTELIIILFIIILVFGVGKLPEIGSGIGRAVKNFRKSVKGEDEIDITPKKKGIQDTKDRKEEIGNRK
jgi:sec-independent protein translocase protein TatA